MAPELTAIIRWTLDQQSVLGRMLNLDAGLNKLANTQAIAEINYLEAQAASISGSVTSEIARLAKAGFDAAGITDLRAFAYSRQSWTGVTATPHPDGLMIRSAYAANHVDLEHVFKLIQGAMRVLGIDKPVVIEWRHGSGGGAAMIRPVAIETMTTWQWAQEAVNTATLRIEQGIDIEPGHPMWADIHALCEMIDEELQIVRDTYPKDAYLEIKALAEGRGIEPNGFDISISALRANGVWEGIKELADLAHQEAPPADDRLIAGDGEALYHENLRRLDLIERVQAYAQARLAAPAAAPSM